jgi:hypothetical protein
MVSCISGLNGLPSNGLAFSRRERATQDIAKIAVILREAVGLQRRVSRGLLLTLQ